MTSSGGVEKLVADGSDAMDVVADPTLGNQSVEEMTTISAGGANSSPDKEEPEKAKMRSVDVEKLGDITAKLEVACREVTAQRMNMNITGNVNSIRVYRRAVESAKRRQTVTGGMTAALANTAHDSPYVPEGKNNLQLALDAALSASQARSSKAADAAMLGGPSVANRLNALEDFDSVCNINLSTGVSHTTTLAAQQDNEDKVLASSSNKKQGSKAVPEGILPRLAKLLVQSQSMGVNQVANQFLRWYPTLTKRQVDLKINELAVKEKLEEDHTKVWHIRPEFKYLLDLEAVENEPSLGLSNRRGAQTHGAFSIYITDSRAVKRAKTTPKTGFQAFAQDRLRSIRFDDINDFKRALIQQWDQLEPGNRAAFEQIARKLSSTITGPHKTAPVVNTSNGEVVGPKSSPQPSSQPVSKPNSSSSSPLSKQKRKVIFLYSLV